MSEKIMNYAGNGSLGKAAPLGLGFFRDFMEMAGKLYHVGFVVIVENKVSFHWINRLIR